MLSSSYKNVNSVNSNGALFRCTSSIGGGEIKVELTYLGKKGSSSSSAASLAHVATASIHPEILRGARLSQVLRGGGALWRTSPIDLDPMQREHLWDISTQQDWLDYFISQSWSTPGWQKYLGLLLGFYWHRVALAGVASLGLILSLELCGVLPSYQVDNDNVGFLRFSPWAAAAPVMALAALFVSPYVSLPWHPREWVFFDAVCINQADESLKKTGIDSLAGFVAHSRQLIVLWTPQYFSRMWCAYEMAMFAVFRHQEDIVFWPLFTQLLWFFGFVFMAVSVILLSVFRILWPHPLSFAMEIVPLYLFLLPPFTLLTRLWRPFMRHSDELPAQLRDFDMTQSECRMDEDREFILRSINHWYGSVDIFNELVRSNLKNIVSSRATGEVGYLHLVTFTSPAWCFHLEWIIGLARAGLDYETIGAQLMVSVAQCLFYFPTILEIFNKLTHLCAGKESNTRWDICYDLALASCLVLASLGTMIGSQVAPYYGLAGALAYASAGVGGAALVWGWMCLARSLSR